MNVIALLFLTLLTLTSLSHAQTAAKPVAKSAQTQLDEKIKLDIFKQYHRAHINPKSLIALIQKSDFRKMSLHAQDELLHDIADEYRGLIQKQNPELSLIFTSKIIKFVYHYLLRELEFKYKKLTDVTTAFDFRTGHLQVYRLSIEPIKNNLFKYNIQKTYNFGFYLDLIALIPLKKTTKDSLLKLNWTTESAEINSEIQLAPRKISRSLIPTSAAPNYKQLVADGVYKGIIVIGSNMGEIAKPLLGNYVNYYLAQGFKFVEVKDQLNTLDYLKANLFQREETTDFLVKEAHSDGDEKNIFRVSELSRMFRAERMNDKNIKEVVEIILPSDYSKKTIAITNNEFATWMKKRELEIGTELIYLNGSCWSLTKALFEVAAVNSPLFINIPSRTVSMTLNQDLKNGTYLLLDGIQKMKTYAQIRNELVKLKTYKPEGVDYYLLPDEKHYQREFSNFHLNNYDYEVRVKTKSNVNSDFELSSIEDDNYRP